MLHTLHAVAQHTSLAFVPATPRLTCSTPPAHRAHAHLQLFWRACRRYLDTWDAKKMQEERQQRAEQGGEGRAHGQPAAEEGPTLMEDFGGWRAELA